MRTSFTDSFNARHLSPEEVAASFVEHDRFDDLWQNHHVVLLGPRGSGKTTLLKMLTAPALHAWEGHRAEFVRENITFAAVYIPTDIHWQHQMRHSTERLRQHPELARLISEAAVTTNVLHSVCTTFRDLMRLSSDGENPKIETAICRQLFSEWRLPASAPLFDNVERGLRSRVNDLYLWANRVATSNQVDKDPAALPDYFFLDYLAATSVACAVFDDLAQSANKRWAMCFDELELAPSWLQERLFNELRSTDQKFLFKLSTSPTPQRGQLTGATERNDYRAIRLWPHSNHDPKPFARRLVVSILQRRCSESVTPDLLFGQSPYAATDDVREYEPGSSTWKAMRDLAMVDPTFRETLERNGISPQDPSTRDVSKRDQVLRKAKPLVLFRNAYIKQGRDGIALVRRSRKVPTIYSGEDAIYDVADGNPRWLIGIVDDLIANIPRSRRGELQPVPPQTQASILKTASEQFGALIQALPEATADFNGSKITLYALLQRIAAFFFRSLVVKRFTLDPPGSFFVDADVPSAIIELLRKALYEGAIVLVNPTENAIGPDLVGKRFRLSYRLAPSLRLPLRLYDAVPLSRCLQEDASTETDSTTSSQDDAQHNLALELQ